MTTPTKSFFINKIDNLNQKAGDSVVIPVQPYPSIPATSGIIAQTISPIFPFASMLPTTSSTQVEVPGSPSFNATVVTTPTVRPYPMFPQSQPISTLPLPRIDNTVTLPNMPNMPSLVMMQKPPVRMTENLDQNEEIRKKIIKHFYHKVNNDWLYKSYKDVLDYFTMKKDKEGNMYVAIIADIKNKSATKDEDIEKKIKFIKKYLLTKEYIEKLLDKYVVKKERKLTALPDYEKSVKKFVKKYVIKYLENYINEGK